MITIPNQSSVPKAWTEFDSTGRMKVCSSPKMVHCEVYAWVRLRISSAPYDRDLSLAWLRRQAAYETELLMWQRSYTNSLCCFGTTQHSW